LRQRTQRPGRRRWRAAQHGVCQCRRSSAPSDDWSPASQATTCTAPAPMVWSQPGQRYVLRPREPGTDWTVHDPSGPTSVLDQLTAPALNGRAAPAALSRLRLRRGTPLVSENAKFGTRPPKSRTCHRPIRHPDDAWRRSRSCPARYPAAFPIASDMSSSVPGRSTVLPAARPGAPLPRARPGSSNTGDEPPNQLAGVVVAEPMAGLPP
jgi:hypothetical protein